MAGLGATQKVVAVVAGVVIAAAASGCGGSGSSSDSGGGGQHVTIGALLPQTGDLAALGKNTSTAVQLAVEQANANQSDVKVTLESQDAGTQESIAQSAIQQLLTKNVSAIVGAVSSAVCLSVVDTTVQARVPMISPACTSPQLTTYADEGYFFRTAAPSEFQGTILANIAYQDGKRKAAVMAVNNSYGLSIAETFKKHFQELGGQIAVDIKYDAAGKSFTAETQRVANAKPDAVVLVGYQDTGAAIVHDAQQRGLLDLAWYTGDGIQDASFPKQALPNDQSPLYTWKGVGIGSSDSPSAKAFADAYQQKFGAAAPSFSAQAYDGAWIAILSSVLADKNDSDAKAEIPNVTDPSGTTCTAAECIPLVAQGKHVSYQGATGPVSFDKNGDPTNAVFAVWQFTADGIKNVRKVELPK
jgi:ABC-type branched-subunit amino acid transport system substrate-binding protein